MEPRIEVMMKSIEAFSAGWKHALKVAQDQAFATRHRMTGKFFDALELEDDCPRWSVYPPPFNAIWYQGKVIGGSK